jgi:hypothetical protein
MADDLPALDRPAKRDFADGILRHIAEIGDGGQKHRLLEQRHKKLGRPAKRAGKYYRITGL